MGSTYEVGDCKSCEAHFHNRHHELILGDGKDWVWFWAMEIQRQVFLFVPRVFENWGSEKGAMAGPFGPRT